MTAAIPTPSSHDPAQDPTRQQRADAAFNQLNPDFELAVDQGVPGWHQAVQQWEHYRSLGGRVDNHLRIDNTGSARAIPSCPSSAARSPAPPAKAAGRRTARRAST